MNELKCDMTETCAEPVAMVDQDGFAYCERHGLQRRDYQPCRRLRLWELAKLQRGEALSRY